jgi:long-chain acyl-CoA synthetase
VPASETPHVADSLSRSAWRFAEREAVCDPNEGVIDRSVDVTPRTLVGHLARHVEASPARLAVAVGTSAVSYGELWERIMLAAGLLREEGVLPGDRVALAAPRKPEFLYAYFACHLLRAVAVPYEPDIAPARFQSIIDLFRPRLMLTHRQTRVDAPGCRSLPLDALTHSAVLPRADEFIEPSPEQPADILLTSGTTGTPKGVILTHRNILAAARNINEFVGNTAEDREAVALPLSHSFGLGRVRCQMLAAGALILTRGFQFPKNMFEAMESWKATGFSFVPAAWNVLTRLTGDGLARFSAELKYIEIGSASMARAEKERLMRLFPSTRICMHYGLTEASRSAFIEFHESSDRLDSIGKPTPNVTIRIVDEEGRDLGPRRIGKIQIRGEHVMGGYWGADSGERLQGGWLRSGDLGYRDEDGYLYICGREDDVINVGGRKVHPTEIERSLLGHEGIADAVCVATPHPITGEAVRALLVPKPGHSELPSADALADFLRATLEEYKIPVAFEWVSSIATNALGKVDRKAMARRVHGSDERTGGGDD